MQRPTGDQLLAYLLGEMPAAQRSEFEQDLARSAELRRALAGARAILETMQTDDSEAPGPDAVSAALRSVLGPAPEPAESWWNQLQQALATLVFDSRAPGALAGLRGTTTAYQLSFEIDGVEIDVEVRSPEANEPARGVILGNVATDTAPGPIALLTEDGRSQVARADADQRGNFRIEARPGHYRLAVRIGTQAILLGGIEIA